MKKRNISTTAVMALAIVAGLFVAAPEKAHADTNITQVDPNTKIVDLHFDIYTKGDDKDKGEAIDFQIMRNDTEIVFDSGWFHRDRVFVPNSYDDRKGKPKVPLTFSDCSKLKLRVEKEGDKPWKVSFRVRANKHTIVLMPETEEVLFGKRNSVNVDQALLGLDGGKTTHLDGGSIHVFTFTSKP
jgi:hypothetical protein